LFARIEKSKQERESAEQRAKDDAFHRKMQEALNSSKSIEAQWQKLQDAFKKMNEAMAHNLAGAMRGLVGARDPLETLAEEDDLDEEQKRDVLGGRPTVQAIATRLAAGAFKHVVVVIGAVWSYPPPPPSLLSLSSAKHLADDENLKKQISFSAISIQTM
jgi:hypothetical protein